MKLLVVVCSFLLCAILANCGSPRVTFQESPPFQVTVIEETKPTVSPTVFLDTPPTNCAHFPQGGFNLVWQNDQVWPRLGCAVKPAEVISGTEAYLRCTHSIWLKERHTFVSLPYIEYKQHLGGWRFIPDESDLTADIPLMSAPFPESGYYFPATGRHSWLANLPDFVEDCDGLSRTSEETFVGQIQQFEKGWLLWNGNVCFVLFDDNTWTMF